MADNRKERQRQRQQRRFALWVAEVRANIARLWESVQAVRDEVRSDPDLQTHFTDWLSLGELAHALVDASNLADEITLRTGSTLTYPLPPVRARKTPAAPSSPKEAE